MKSLARMSIGPLLAVAATGLTLSVNATAAEAAPNAAVRVSATTLTVRSAPSTSASVVAKLPNRAKISVECRVGGQYVRGTVRWTAQWDRLGSGRYISHAYVSTKATFALCAAPVAAPVVATPAPVVAIPAGPTSTRTNAEFIAASAPGARDGQVRYRVPASVTLAQAILESGWGRSPLSTVENNFFGMKCHDNVLGPWAQACKVYLTTECDAAGVCTPQTAIFKSYASAANSFNDHGYMLSTNPRYAAAFTQNGNADLFVAEVHKAGYATDPQYTVKLVTIMQKYNLYQYDA